MTQLFFRCNDIMVTNDISFLRYQNMKERIKILVIHCPDILGTNYNIDYFCSDKRGIITTYDCSLH